MASQTIPCAFTWTLDNKVVSDLFESRENTGVSAAILCQSVYVLDVMSKASMWDIYLIT